MQQIAHQQGLTIAPQPGDFSDKYDVVAYGDSSAMCGYFDVNPYASTVGLLLVRSLNLTTISGSFSTKPL